MNKIIILDFRNGEVTILNYDTNIWSDAEEYITFLYDEGLIQSLPTDCQWMINKELILNIK